MPTYLTEKESKRQDVSCQDVLNHMKTCQRCAQYDEKNIGEALAAPAHAILWIYIAWLLITVLIGIRKHR
jgi:hypothetical protein